VVEASDIPEKLYKNVFGLSLWDPEEENRETAEEMVKKIGMENITEFPGWLEPFEDCEGFGFYFTLEASIVHEAAAETLRKIGDTRAVEPLITAFWGAGWGYTSDDWPVGTIQIAAKALGEIGDARAVEVLIEALGKSGSFANEYRVAAADALGKIGNVRVVEPLIELLGDEEGNVRSSAAIALGSIGDARAVEPLIEALNDSSVGKFAAEALEKIGDARAVEGLIEALVNDDEYISRNALEPLIRIGVPAVEPLVEMADHLIHYDCHRDWGIFQVVEALMGIGVMRLEPFIRALGNEEYNVRYTAAEVLEHILNEGLITYSGRYWAAVELDDFHERCSSIKALGDENEYVREAAKEALKKLGHEVE
jgi:HEAT repeat protein